MVRHKRNIKTFDRKARDKVITAKQYTETYERYTKFLRENAERIRQSSETRKYLMKKSGTAPLEDRLIEAVKCISDLTGDTILPKTVIKNIERRKHERDYI